MSRLKTERLRLEPVGLDDFPDLLSHWADPDFTRFITGSPLGEEDVWLRCLRDIGHWQALGYGNWTLRTPSGQFVGSVGLLNYHRSLPVPLDAPELGWGLAPRFHGQGLAYEAVSTILEWGQQSLNMKRTVCMISPENLASIRLALRLDYRPFAETQYKGHRVTLYERL